jgi:hypothetical protein
MFTRKSLEEFQAVDKLSQKSEDVAPPGPPAPPKIFFSDPGTEWNATTIRRTDRFALLTA